MADRARTAPTTFKEYGVYGLPMTVFIGTDGKVREISKGELTGNTIRDRASTLFK
jgi:thiol:disulfide interchange protein